MHKYVHILLDCALAGTEVKACLLAGSHQSTNKLKLNYALTLSIGLGAKAVRLFKIYILRNTGMIMINASD